MLTAEQLQLVLAELAQERPVFHSEADFQHSFAWALHLRYPKAQVRLELPEAKLGGRLDLALFTSDWRVAIELKYKTCLLTTIWEGEAFALKDQSAEDLGCYDFWKDVERLEKLQASYSAGYALLLTNCPAYWQPNAGQGAGFDDFRTGEGRKVSGRLALGGNFGEAARKARPPLGLAGRYTCHWSDYSVFDVLGSECFRYLLIPVLPVEV